MEIDCDRCTARGPACGDCVVTVILGEPPVDLEPLDDDDWAALAVLADSGLVPPLRHEVVPVRRHGRDVRRA
jgi:hypothetical protein